MSKIRVIVDSNVFVNSWFSTKYFYCDAVIDLINNDEIELLFSQDTIGELAYVVKKIVLDVHKEEKEMQIEYMNNISYIFLNATSINTKGVICPNIKDKFDKMFLETAIKGKADYVVSEDKNSGMHEVKLFYGTKVVDSEDFIKMYERLRVGLLVE